MEIYGYKKNNLKTFLTWIAIITSGFLLRLILYWKPHWMLYLTCNNCPLSKAEKVLLIDEYNQYFVEKVEYFNKNDTTTISSGNNISEYKEQIITHNNDNDDVSVVVAAAAAAAANNGNSQQNQINNNRGNDSFTSNPLGKRFFENKKIRYIWNDEKEIFIRLWGLDKNVTFSQLQSMTDGLSESEQTLRRQLFGENAIHIEVQPYFRILFEEVLGPFYIFQLFSITVWFNDNYFYYGTCIIIMSLLSLISGVIQIRKNQQQLRDTVESVDYIKVCRGQDQYEDIESSKLVPGDIVVVPTFNSILQFDGILINGNVIVNESMLTGESVPVTKTPLPLEQQTIKSSQQQQEKSIKTKQQQEIVYYDEKEHAKHTLFAGTKVMQTRYYGGVYVKALVIRVGFQTAKGELIRSIMFPKPVDYRFNKQINKFIGVLACAALVGFLYSIILKSGRGAELKQILISALDLITIVVPPALPAAMTIGLIYAQSRLRSNKIYCISPRSINISGCINCVCFDKTGTLTEDNLSFNEVVPLIEDKCLFGEPFDEQVMQTNVKQIERDNYLLLENGNYSPLMICLASCHSLTIIEDKIIGDPLDLQMFEATGWRLEEPDVDDENKFDLLAPTVVRPPRRKRRTPLEAETYATNSEIPSSGSSTEEDDNQIFDPVSVNTNTRSRCQMDVGILRQFPFSSNLQRMSVITRQFNGNQYVVYCKGAPEKIVSLCKQETIPDDFHDVLHGYTRKGFRVLALAYRPLKVGLSYTRMQRASRQDIEKDLRFLGLLILGNLLKEETISVIEKLNKAAIRSVMVTGDNMLTAISVANECGMIQANNNDKTLLLQVEKVAQLSTSNANNQNNNIISSKSSKKANRNNKQQKSSSSLSDETSSSSPEQVSRKQQQKQIPPTPIKESVILNVDSIKYKVRKESDPLLSVTTKSYKGPIRPKLTWHYVNNDNQQPIPADPYSIFSSYTNNSGQFARLNFANNNDTTACTTSTTHLALTGDTWDVILKFYPELLDLICYHGTVFARMAPHQKQQLVEQLQVLKYYVGMCGDGANDSGALKSAHAGISLSDTEASVAAPFTSANANISCVPILIGEGRAALVTAFGILKYMALYSMTQFCSVLALYTLYTNFTDTQFLYEDLFIIATMVAVFGRTEPYPILDNKAPSSSLLSVAQLSSVGIQLGLVIIFQMISLLILWQNPWYEVHQNTYDHELATHDNFAIFAMSSFQCISLAIIFSKGKPYRKSILSNYLLTGALTIITTSTIILLLIPAEWNVPYISLEVQNVPIEFRIIMICLAGVHFIVAFICERFIVDHLIFRKSGKLLELFGINPSNKKHHRQQQQQQKRRDNLST